MDFLERSFARRATADFLREAVFFFKRPFLAALSYSLWIFFMFSAEGSALKALRASLMFFLISRFLRVRFSAWRAAFLADLIIGIRVEFLLG